jgi:hypothetical protein
MQMERYVEVKVSDLAVSMIINDERMSDFQ